MSPSPSSRLKAQLIRCVQRLERRIARLERLSLRFSRGRMALFVLGALTTFVVSRAEGGAAGWTVLAVFAAGFGVVAYLHNRIVVSIRRHQIYARIKRTHIARMDRDWEGLPESGLEEAGAEHAYGRDLNVTGARSLHHLLDTSFTREGSRRLGDWLLNGFSGLESTALRQALVRDLKPMTAFRDRLSLLSALVSGHSDERWEGDLVLRWLDRHADAGLLPRVLAGLSLLAATTLVLFVLWIVDVLGTLWLLSFLLYVGIYLFNYRLYAHLFDEAEHLYYQLVRFRPILMFLESWKYGPGVALAAHCAPFTDTDDDRPPSAYLKRILWLSIAASGQKNEVVRLVLNVLLPWDLLFTYLLSRYKKRLRTRLPVWLDRVQTLEAANSLATFGALHPENVFPKIRSETDGLPIYDAIQLGHPLLAEGAKIRNDFRVDSVHEIALITGSNMSGKSTFLRTVGVNTVLAYAGGPVDARSFVTVPMRLFTCMNVSDSVTDGISYFYAEVRRLKALSERLAEGAAEPLLYLVDEIFRGTNNRERLTGSRGLLLSLVGGHGAGVVSTHDLELVQLEDEAEGITNFHFREHVEDGRMIFDYRLRPGPCPTTNALKIMRMEGLPVDPHDS